MEQSTPIPISSLFAGTIEALSAVAAARSPRERAAIPVSYTHLTLPTSDLV